MMKSSDIVVVGGGVIGCAVAYYAAKRGLQVTLIDQPKRGRATSASAGGLWPLGESIGLGCGVIFYKAQLAKGIVPEGADGPAQLPRSFLDFAMQSNAMFPTLTEELRETGGLDIELERTSLLYLIYDEADEAFARPLWRNCPCGRSLSEWLTPEELARAEPAVTRNVRGALRFNGDDQVNPYRLADAYRAAARALGAELLPYTEVTNVRVEKGRVVAVETAAQRIRCDVVVNAAGAWAPQIARMVGIDLPVQPVRGQIIGTETLPDVLSSCLSTTDCYLAQKRHGEIIIGSTTEEVGFDVGVTRSGIKTLAAGAIRALPFLKQVNVKRVWAGLRPGTPDELPVLGPIESVTGYYNACGHFRTGILNSPLTGLLLAELLSGAPLSFPIEPFLLSRLAPMVPVERLSNHPPQPNRSHAVANGEPS
ncbi:MAG: FAD-dependent oxidoreductase [Alphaproteobacteria bacterium]|nr:FAD-dependent oxidoreductase [Alphaproteobacteria bacterium]